MGARKAASTRSSTTGGRGADEERTKRSRARAMAPAWRCARARMSWCMVGTAVYQVGRYSSSQSKKRKALKSPGQATAPPAASGASSPATMPWMWKRGIVTRPQSSGARARERATDAAETARFACVRGTVLGRAVVPEVCSTRAVASGAGGATGAGATGTPPSVSVTPRPSPATARRRTPGASGTSPASGAAAMARTPSSAKARRTSSVRERGLSGAATAALAAARRTVAMAGPLGSVSATRSPGPTPAARSCPASRATVARSSAKEPAPCAPFSAGASSAPAASRSGMVAGEVGMGRASGCVPMVHAENACMVVT